MSQFGTATEQAESTPVVLGAGGVTIWFTGLSGAGKSTLAHGLATVLRERGRSVEVLDGDEVREHLSKGLGFSREDRDTNVRRIAYVAKLLTRHGVTVITAAISPYRDVRDEARREIGSFIEIYVRCALDSLVRRDPKGLYARALRGEIAHFTGVSDPYEEPVNPEVVIDTDHEPVAHSLARILAYVDASAPAATGAAVAHSERQADRPAAHHAQRGLP